MKLSKLPLIILLLFINSFAGQMPDAHGEALCVQPSAGMVSWWDGDNNTVDLVSRASGTMMGGATYAAGMVGQAFSFDGTDDYVDLPDGFADFTSGFTVTLWANPTSYGYWARFIDLGNGQADNNILFDRRSTSNDLTLEVYDGGGSSTGMAYAVDAITNNEWHHYAATLDGAGKVKMYKDGLPLVLAADTTGVPNNVTRTSNFIGRSNWPSDAYYAGSIDEVQIYNRVLDAAEIVAIYNAGSAGNCKPQCAPLPSEMVSWWTGDTSANDIVGGYNGTLVNNAAYGPGKVGQAFSFDGTNQHVELPEPVGDFGATAFSVDFWMYTSDPGSTSGHYILGKSYPDGGQGWDVRYYNRTVTVEGWSFEITSDAITLDEWHHIAVSATVSDITLYIDGVVKGTSVRPTSITSTSNPFRIGYTTGFWPYTGIGFNGLIDEIGIFTRALTAQEVVAIYNAAGNGMCRSCTAPPSNMISWWKGEEDANDSVGTNNGTLMNGATFVAGKVDQAFSFDGVDDYISIPHNANLDPSAITVDAWIKTPAGPERVIVEKSHDNTGGWVMEVHGDGRASFAYFNGDMSWTTNSVFSIGTVADNNWHHVAATLEGSAIKIYIDGALDNSAVYSGTPIPNSRNVNIGKWYGGGRFFNGLIDEVEIFSRALSAQEIAAIYNAGSAGTCVPDTTPDSFTFADETDVDMSTVITSDTISVNGINAAASISIADCSGTNCEYRINTEGWTSDPGTVNNGDMVTVRQTSSSSYSTPTDLTLEIGGVSDTFSVTTIAGADLSITKTDAGYDPINAGGKVTYTITVTNLGPDAASMVNLTDDLPAGTVADPVPNCSYNTELNQVNCLLVGTLLNGESMDKTITVTVPSTPGVITNTASVTSDTEDPDLTNNTATQDTTVQTTLTVSVMPDAANGTVTATGINCGQGNTDCTEAYSTAATVNLTATPATGWRFLRWEGALTGDVNPDTVTMSADRSAAAVFATDRTVCSDPLVCFTTIQAAIDAAGPGDVVKVPQGTYHEKIVIDTDKELTISGGWNSDFTVQSLDPTQTIIDGNTDGYGLSDNSVIYISAGKDITLYNITVMNGYAPFGGGILFWAVTDGQRLEVRNCIIRENGGGIAAYGPVTGAATVELKNTLIADNAATNYPGISATTLTPDSSVTMRLENCTVSDNRALNGGGLMASASPSGTVLVEIGNSIIWGNRKSDLSASDIYYYGFVTIQVLNSDIGTVESGGSGTFTDLGGNISSDPVFVNPAFLDYRLNSDSPGIDTGDNASASGLSTDIAGQSRVVDGNSDSTATVDMGAFEYQPTTPSAIKLLSLNGGEVIDAGMPFDITWEAPASAQRFKVFYSLDNGLTWLKAVSADDAVTGNIVTGQQHFRWDVPVQAKNKKSCKIKVTGYTGAGVKVGADISDLPFMIRAASLVRPNGPDPLHYGETYIIRWDTTERPKAEVTTVTLSYTTDGGLTWKAIGVPITGNPGSYSWTVPTFTKAKAKCRVKVDLYSGTTKVGSDTSDYFFTIGL